jgi:DNA topoisomerase-3
MATLHPEIGTCPICQEAPVRVGPKSYYCSNAVGTRKKCTFFLGKEIRSCLITESDARMLIDRGRTGLIKGFYSKWGNPFSACLVLQNGKIQFDFPTPKKLKPKRPIIIYTAGTDTNRRRH